MPGVWDALSTRLVAQAGFSRCRTTVVTPFNLVIEARP
jgi:2-methylisocitrate lyase-like PEP mutase family enzyme